MADEISQVVEVECKGVYYLLKGSYESIATAVKVIKALSEWHHKKWLDKPGSCSWKKLQEASEGNAAILEFPKEMFEKTEMMGGKKVTPFEKYCVENELRYSIMPDLNTEDDYIPVGIVSQDMAIHQEHIKTYMNMRIQSEESQDKNYDELISQAKDTLQEATTVKEKEDAEIALQKLLDAKKQNGDLLEESKEKLEKDNIITFEEYLKQGEGTKLVTNPEAALREEDTCGVVREFMPYDCMYPIRDEGMVPESKEIYYSQRTKDNDLYTIKRKFEEDSKGVVYSIYEVTNPDHVDMFSTFSDRNCTQDMWKQQLPVILKKAGMFADAPTTALQSEDRLRAYCKGIDLNFTKASGMEQESAPSSKEAEKFIGDAKLDTKVRTAYENTKMTTITVPAMSIMPDGEQILSLELAEGLVEGITLEDMNSEEARIGIDAEKSYIVRKPDGMTDTMSGRDVIASIGKAKDDTRSESMSQARSARKQV